jgi:Protein of unknown function (DUF4230)
MKLINLLVLLLVGFLVLGMRTLWWRYSSNSSRSATWQSSGPTVESVRRLADLLTLRVSISDVLVGEGYGYRGVWIVKGDAFFGIDLDEISVPADLQDKANQTATIVLPRPRLKYARLNHDLTRTWDVARDAWWRLPSGECENRLRDESMRQGQHTIEFAANKAEYVREAQTQTAEAIRTMYRHVGWNVTVVWKEESVKSRVKGELLSSRSM